MYIFISGIELSEIRKHIVLSFFLFIVFFLLLNLLIHPDSVLLGVRIGVCGAFINYFLLILGAF